MVFTNKNTGNCTTSKCYLSIMSDNKSFSKNGVKETGPFREGFSPGRLPVGEQHRADRHPATARKEWTKNVNMIVMECYYRSKPVSETGVPIRGYRRRMYSQWKIRGIFDSTEQRICDQARAIKKNGWLSDLELEAIRRNIEMEDNVANNVEIREEKDHHETNSIVEEACIQQLEVIEEEVVSDDASVKEKTCEEMDLTAEERDILDQIRQFMGEGERCDGIAFKRVERKRLRTATERANRVIKCIDTNDITETNNLIVATSVWIAKELGLKKHIKRVAKQEPWWKRRIKESIIELRKHINIFQRQQKGEMRKLGKYNELVKKYKVKEKGISKVMEELKQRLQVKASKLKRYEQRIEQYRINRMYQQDQKRVYQEMSGKPGEKVMPDAEKSVRFWSGIWDNDIHHNSKAEWLDDVRKEVKSMSQKNVVVTEEMMKNKVRKLPNWKAPGPDGVQGYWLKNLPSLHDRIVRQMNDMINNNKDIPDWLTKGRTVLCQKDPQKGDAVDNFRPISCLPLMWKLMTGIISDVMYEFLVESDYLPLEQKGCKKQSRGAKDQLLIDKAILRDSKKKHRNLAMAWVDYRKAYDMVPHSWIIESLRLAHVAQNIIDFIERSMNNWKTDLTACGQILGTVSIKRGIFQGDSLSPLIFILCIIPMTKILRNMRAGYMLGNVKVNHLLFMDDLKVFGKNEKEIDSLIKTVEVFSCDIGMEFGIKKCGVACVKRGKLSKAEGLRLLSGKMITEVNEEGYRYLGIIELDKVKEQEMKLEFRAEYMRRLKLIMKSKLHGRHKIKAINTWAVSLLRYGAGIIEWTKEDLQKMDRKTRKVMTMNKEFHPKSDTARLYVSRKKGGRGLISCEECVRTEENSLNWYIENSNEEMLANVNNHKIMRNDEAVEPVQYKANRKQIAEAGWKEKVMHGQFVRELKGVDWDKTWQWLMKGDLKGCTEALICSAQEQALRTNYIKFHIDKTVESPLCRMCGERGESIYHLISECGKLAQREYKRRHDDVARYVHWQICRESGIESCDKWYEHKPECVLENKDYKIFWDFMIQCDRLIEARKPDVVLIDKRTKGVKIIDIAIPGDKRVKDKEIEKLEKYQMLKEEVQRLWKMKSVTVLPVVIGALGAVSQRFAGYVNKVGANIKLEIIQKTALLGTARLLRKVLSL